jgi:hypothetical protein
MAIKNLESEFLRLRKSTNDEIEKKARIRSNALLLSLKNATPIDTGKAAASWNLQYNAPFQGTSAFVRNNDFATIKSDVHYMEYLNAGSSQQAPARFIERIALNYGAPVGTIVTKNSSEVR